MGPLPEDNVSPCNEEGPNMLTRFMTLMQRYKVSMKIGPKKG